MRLNRGSLTKLAGVTGIPAQTLSEYVNARIRPGGQRAVVLADACKELGINVGVRLWLTGTAEQIKAAFNGSVEARALRCTLTDERVEDLKTWDKLREKIIEWLR